MSKCKSSKKKTGGAGPSSSNKPRKKSDHQEYLDLLRRYQKDPESWQGSFEEALAEIKRGRKRSHWIWYVFPQTYLNSNPSEMARRFQIKPEKCLDIAEAILEDEVLGQNFIDICQALNLLEGTNGILHIMGSSTDRFELRSCLTLFSKTRKNQPGKIEAEKAMKLWFPNDPCKTTLRDIARYYP